MPTETTHPCPGCGGTRTRNHCGGASHACDLITCFDCHHFGKPDGSRWALKVGAPGPGV